MYDDVKEGNDIFNMNIPALPPRVINIWAKQSVVITKSCKCNLNGNPNGRIINQLIYMLGYKSEIIVSIQDVYE